MNKYFLPFLFLIGAITLLTGCSSAIERIGVQVQLVKLEQQTDGSLLASLQFSNPNVNSLNVIRSTHQLALNGKSLGVLAVVEPLGLPAQQAITLTVAVKRSGGKSVVAGKSSYHLTSALTLSIYDTDENRFKTSSSGAVTVQ